MKSSPYPPNRGPNAFPTGVGFSPQGVVQMVDQIAYLVFWTAFRPGGVVQIRTFIINNLSVFSPRLGRYQGDIWNLSVVRWVLATLNIAKEAMSILLGNNTRSVFFKKSGLSGVRVLNMRLYDGFGDTFKCRQFGYKWGHHRAIWGQFRTSGAQ